MAFDVFDHVRIFWLLTWQFEFIEGDYIIDELFSFNIEYVDVSLFHADENMSVILGLVCQERRDVEAAYFFTGLIRVRHLNLHLAVI